MTAMSVVVVVGPPRLLSYWHRRGAVGKTSVTVTEKLILFLLVGWLKRWRQDTQQNYTQHNDTQHNDTKHNDTQHNDTQHNDTQQNGLICDAQQI
jgi:hypothetical protein